MEKKIIDENEIMRIKQNQYAEKAREQICSFAKEDFCPIYKIHTISIFGKSLEVNIFFKTNKELSENNISGKTEEIKNKFINILKELGYFLEFPDKIMFFFDSHENVKKKYKGNYFLRLR